MIMSLAKKVAYSVESKKFVFSEKVQQALSSLEWEGIDLPVESLRDIALLEMGELSKEKFIAKTIVIAHT